MRISNDFILKEVAGNVIVVPVGDKSINFNAIIHLNGVGTFLFKALQEKDMTAEELAQKVCDNYDVSYDIALSDVNAFCIKLSENNILEK